MNLIGSFPARLYFLRREAVQERPSKHYAGADPDRGHRYPTTGKRISDSPERPFPNL